MQVHTRFFASYRDMLGATALDVTLPDGATVKDLVGTLRSRGDGFARLPTSPAVAVNRCYSRLDRSLTDGDEVAFIPPVAGG